MKRRLGDRRIRPRFEIVGELWGTLETVLRLPLRDVGIGGALFESHVPLVAESIHRLAWKCQDRDTAVQVRVRHVRPSESADGERSYLIGIEFLSLNSLIAGQIQQWLAAQPAGDAGPAEPDAIGDGVQERRRAPRVAVDELFDCRFEMRARVRLMDISATGALLVSDEEFPIETEGQLKAALAASRFSPSLQVRRTAMLPRNEGTQLGTVFVGMDDESRKCLEAFLQKATT